MADLVGSVEKIVRIALAIKEAVDTVRHNKKECVEIGNRVMRIRALLSQLQVVETTAMEPGAMMGDTLRALEETLHRTSKLVKECQKINPMRRYVGASDLCKQLRDVKQEITDHMMDGLFAANVNATIMLMNIQRAASIPRLEETEVVKHEARKTRRLRQDKNILQSDEVLSGEKKSVPAGSQLPFTPTCLTKFTFGELEAATHLFSQENIVGDGASAIVFKAVLTDGVEVAIKKFKASVGFSLAQFYDEFNLVPKLEHKNIIKLQGYCHEVAVGLEWLGEKYVGAEARHCLFVEEYAPNGSLEKIINGGSQLQWPSLMQIIQGIAHGLDYLHEQRVVHSDLKPVNIVMDSGMNAKISDFGMARTLDHSDDMTIRDDNYLAGTVGYMPPEYIIQGILSTKYDVYSFGVILLEIISGMCRPDQPARRQAAVEWAWEVWQAGVKEELSVRDPSQHKQVKTYMEVGLLCTQINRKDRPSMADVLVMLDGQKELPTPKKPRYTKGSAAAVPTASASIFLSRSSSRNGGGTIRVGRDRSSAPQALPRRRQSFV